MSAKGFLLSGMTTRHLKKFTLARQTKSHGSDEIDMCPDSIYMQLSGKTVEEIYPNLKEMQVDA